MGDLKRGPDFGELPMCEIQKIGDCNVGPWRGRVLDISSPPKKKHDPSLH